jgi:WxcM-like, C-terminal
MSLEQYSQPIVRDKSSIRTIVTLNPRDSKKGRLFMPVYDSRYPYTEDFENLPFVYVSQFLEKWNASWNHYHKKKREILIPLHGRFEFHFEDTVSKEREVFTIDSSECKAVIVPLLVSHRIISLLDTWSLLVLASTPSDLDDEIEYEVE